MNAFVSERINSSFVFIQVIDSESIGEEDQGSDITRFLEGYKQGKTVSKRISGPSFIQFLNSMVGFKLIFIFVFVVAVILMIQTIGRSDEDNDVRRPLRPDTSEAQRVGDKED